MSDEQIAGALGIGVPEFKEMYLNGDESFIAYINMLFLFDFGDILRYKENGNDHIFEMMLVELGSSGRLGLWDVSANTWMYLEEAFGADEWTLFKNTSKHGAFKNNFTSFVGIRSSNDFKGTTGAPPNAFKTYYGDGWSSDFPNYYKTGLWAGTRDCNVNMYFNDRGPLKIIMNLAATLVPLIPAVPPGVGIGIKTTNAFITAGEADIRKVVLQGVYYTYETRRHYSTNQISSIPQHYDGYVQSQ